jgi:hypothetical protein
VHLKQDVVKLTNCANYDYMQWWVDSVPEKGPAKRYAQYVDFTSQTLCQYADREGSFLDNGHCDRKLHVSRANPYHASASALQIALLGLEHHESCCWQYNASLSP